MRDAKLLRRCYLFFAGLLHHHVGDKEAREYDEVLGKCQLPGCVPHH